MPFPSADTRCVVVVVNPDNVRRREHYYKYPACGISELSAHSQECSPRCCSAARSSVQLHGSRSESISFSHREWSLALDHLALALCWPHGDGCQHRRLQAVEGELMQPDTLTSRRTTGSDGRGGRGHAEPSFTPTRVLFVEVVTVRVKKAAH